MVTLTEAIMTMAMRKVGMRMATIVSGSLMAPDCWMPNQKPATARTMATSDAMRGSARLMPRPEMRPHPSRMASPARKMRATVGPSLALAWKPVVRKVMATKAPIMKTSPWAKLMSSMMP